jgi:DNA polymerase III delta prime subunit
MNDTIHEKIKEKLNFFIQTDKIPNILFHGPCGSGKRTLVHNFVTDIYKNNKELINAYVMNVNCAHGKGIKFVREDLKFFAKTHINIQGSSHFKILILSNADKLTIDAQSALRRCIELFSHTTRFFIIVEDKYKLLKPVISRFCEIFVSEPIMNGKQTNLHTYGLNNDCPLYNNIEKKRDAWLKKTLQSYSSELDNVKLLDLSIQLYEKSYSGIDLINYIEQNDTMQIKWKYQLLIAIHKIKRELKNEKLIIYFILFFLFLRSKTDLENILFM